MCLQEPQVSREKGRPTGLAGNRWHGAGLGTCMRLLRFFKLSLNKSGIGGGHGNCPISVPGESHGHRSVAGYNPQSCKESDAHAAAAHTLAVFI